MLTVAKGAPAVKLTVEINGTAYAVDRLDTDSELADKAFRLTKHGGVTYDVAATPQGLECTCPDFVYRRANRDANGCKHLAALRSFGLLEWRE